MSYGLCSLAGRMWNPKPRNLWRMSKNIEDIMKDIWKEYKDKDGSKGGGSVQEISRLMKIFKDRWWKFVMGSLKANILLGDMMKMSSKPNGSISIPKKRIYFSHHQENEVSKSE